MSGAIPEELRGLSSQRWKKTPTDHEGTVKGDSLQWIIDVLNNDFDNVYDYVPNPDPYLTLWNACPVDVKVQCGVETLEYSLTDGKYIARSSFGRMDVIGEDDDIKMFCIDERDDYEITMAGTGTGTMDYELRFFDGNDKLICTYGAKDVPITPATLIKTGTNTEQEMVLSIDEDGDGTEDKIIPLLKTIPEDDDDPPTSYTVTYNANGGISPPEEQTKTQDVILTLSNDEPTRDGYTFKGWATNANATTAQYQPGGSYTANASVTLYAVWEADHTHSFGNEWESDDTNHWHECACGEKSGIAAHTPGDWIVDIAATATQNGSRHKECSVCGYVTEMAAIPATGEGHTHTFESEWKKDETLHWKECSCGEKDDFALHTPGNWIVDTPVGEFTPGSRHKECTVCGYVTANEIIPATHTHTRDAEWKKDATNHWYECACGEEKAGIAPHTPGNWIVDVAATATTVGSRHKECTVCGYTTVTEVIPATGEGHMHSFGLAWTKNASGHWHECACGEKDGFAAHSPGDWIIDVAATVAAQGSRHKECTVCGFTTATEAIPATGAEHTHSFGTAWKKDTTGHWHECSCGEKDGFAAHTPGSWVVDVAATATANGSRHRECTVCGLLTATETIPATGSTPVYKITSGANQSWKKGAATGATITCDGDFSKFVELKIDGLVVTAANYTKASGSTIISLNASYLETLSPGFHTIEFVYGDGSVQTGLTILANDTITPVPANNSGSDTGSSFLNPSNGNSGSTGPPKTGERLSGAMIALIIFFVLDMAFVAWKIYEHARRPRRRVLAH